MLQLLRPGPRSIGRIDPVYPADACNGTRRSIGSSGMSENIGSNVADALATYWRRIYIQITAAVSNCVAKMTQFVVNTMSFYRNQLQSSLYSGLSTVRMRSLYFMAETDWFFIPCSRIGS